MTDDPRVSFDKHGAPPPGQPPGQPQPYPYAPPHYGYPGFAPYGYPGAGYPGYGYPAGLPHEKPSTNVGWAIAAIFTFWPLAIPSFVYANKVDAFWFAGNRAGAEQASRDARLWGLIGVVVGGVLFVLLLLWIVFVFSLVTGAANNLPDPSTYPTSYPT